MKIILKFFLVSLIILWVVNAQSQEPSPQPFKDIQKPQQNAREIYKSTNTNQQGTEKYPTVFKEIPSDITNEETKKEANKESDKSFYDKLIAWSTVLLAIITAVLAFFTYRLWASTKDTAKRQLRAYVFMKPKDGENMFDDSNGCLTAPLIVKNFGQTPAYDILCSLQMAPYKFPLDTTLESHAYEPTASKSPLAPGDQVRQYITLGDKLTETERNNILKSKIAIFVWGEVLYFDAFKTKHRSNLCLYSTGADFGRGELAYYHDGNNAD